MTKPCEGNVRFEMARGRKIWGMPDGSGYVPPLVQLSYKSARDDQIRRSKQLLLFRQQRPRRLPIDLFKSNLIPWPKLPEAMKIRRNHIGDLRISARGLLFHKENNGLPSLRYLHSTKRHTLRNHLSA